MPPPPCLCAVHRPPQQTQRALAAALVSGVGILVTYTVVSYVSRRRKEDHRSTSGSGEQQQQQQSHPRSPPEGEPNKCYVVDRDLHTALITKAFKARGFDDEESVCAAEFCTKASWCGVSSHNAIKALQVDAVFGSGKKTDPGKARRCTNSHGAHREREWA